MISVDEVNRPRESWWRTIRPPLKVPDVNDRLPLLPPESEEGGGLPLPEAVSIS